MIHYQNLAVVCVPKAGSSILRTYFQTVKGSDQPRGSNGQHNFPLSAIEFPREPVPERYGKPVTVPENYYVYGTVRHPVSWMRSYWCYRKKECFKPFGSWPLDHMNKTLPVDTFENFIDSVLNYWPGYVGELYHRMLCHAHYVGQTENIGPDTLEAMTRAGCSPIEETKLLNYFKTVRKNEADIRMKEEATLSELLEVQFLAEERMAMAYWWRT